MFNFIRPKEDIFFDLFNKGAENASKAAVELKKFMSDLTNIEVKVKAIEEIEHAGDTITHQIIEQLNKSFITPIDREDIFTLAREIDTIVDLIEATAFRFYLFNINSSRKEADELVDMIVESTVELEGLIKGMRNIKDNVTLKEKIVEVNRLEDLSDDMYRASIRKLFLEETNPIEIIKWREIYEHLENTIDACETVANIIEGVVMKNA